jgi:NTP pyrophosphatase (non-canonical NTP hydrolase)
MNYIEEALRTSSSKADISDRKAQLLHAAVGLCTESAEFLDVLKKAVFYCKPMTDKELLNLEEELGDLCWYMAIAMHQLGTDFDKVQRRNIAKLKKRYPEKFTLDNAENRDLDGEVQAMQQVDVV